MFFIMASCSKRPRKNTAFYLNIGGEPTSLHAFNAVTDGYTSVVMGYSAESLLARDLDTYEWKPALATSWKISDDKMKFTFKLRKNVFFHDGTKMSADDVKFSFDAIFDDKYKAIAVRSFYEGIKEVEVLDSHTVVFHAKDKSYKNFTTAAGMLIFSKNFFSQNKKKSFFNKNIIGTGPYKLDLYKRGSRIVLVKNKDWWGYSLPEQKEWNFEKIVLRFVADTNVALEMLKKGALDFLAVSPEYYVKKMNGKQWSKKVHKVKVENSSPKGYSWIGWNLLHPILKDKRVRKALYMLVNRKLMIEKFEYGYSTPLAGPVYPQSPYAVDVEPVKFNLKKAASLLAAAGWKDTDGDRVLDKIIDGKKVKFSITILEPSDFFMKYLTVFKEDAKKVGVELNLKRVEWNSFIKLIDEKKFEAIRLAWTAVIDWDPTQIWHSKSINGGSNFISFKNKRVDEICDKAKYIHDKEKRIELLKEAQKIIIDEAPYVWFTNKASTMYGHTDRIKKEKNTYKYGVGNSFWKFKRLIREAN
jgi:peptide/nickel transport system substrate-binding protein/microcin C transport system substrate-binding protein